MRPLNFTLIGAGGFGGTHIAVLRKMAEEGLARLTDIVDPSPELIPAVYEAAIASGIRWHRSWEERLQSGPTSDCISIAAPIHLHLDYARKAYATGAYVYLEKPPVPLLGQMEELAEMEAQDRRIHVGFTFPYSAQMRVLKRWIEEGQFGRIVSYRLTASAPRADRYYQRNGWAGKIWLGEHPVLDGPASNAIAHRIHDLLSIERFAAGESVIPETVLAELYRGRPIESYDACSVRGEFPSGATFGITLSHAVTVNAGARIEIIGTKGRATLSGPELALSASFTDEVVSTEVPLHYLAFRDFIQKTRDKEKPTVGIPDTLPYVMMINSMFISSGGVHSVHPEHCLPVTTPDGTIYSISDIHQLSEQAFATGMNFSELDAPWGVKGKPISPETLIASEIERQIGAMSMENPMRRREAPFVSVTAQS